MTVACVKGQQLNSILEEKLGFNFKFCLNVIFSSVQVLGEGRISISRYSKARCPEYCWWHHKGDFSTIIVFNKFSCQLNFLIRKIQFRTLNSWFLIQGYGCPGLSITGAAIALAETARVDASLSSSILVHSSLAMLTIGEIFIFHLILLEHIN